MLSAFLIGHAGAGLCFPLLCHEVLLLLAAELVFNGQQLGGGGWDTRLKMFLRVC